MTNVKQLDGDKQYDIKRLGRIITLTNKMLEIVYHMDEREYKRFRSYLDNRTGISFPFDRPKQTSKQSNPTP